MISVQCYRDNMMLARDWSICDREYAAKTYRRMAQECEVMRDYIGEASSPKHADAIARWDARRVACNRLTVIMRYGQ